MTWVAFLINGQCGEVKNKDFPDYYPVFCHEFDSEERARALGPEYTVMPLSQYEGYLFGCEVALKHSVTNTPKMPWYLFWR